MKLVFSAFLMLLSFACFSQSEKKDDGTPKPLKGKNYEAPKMFPSVSGDAMPAIIEYYDWRCKNGFRNHGTSYPNWVRTLELRWDDNPSIKTAEIKNQTIDISEPLSFDILINVYLNSPEKRTKINKILLGLD